MKTNLLELLSKHYLFASLDETTKAEITKFSKIKNYLNGNTIFIKNQALEDFYIVVSGEVRLFFSTPDGKEKTIKTFKPSQSFAEALMFMQQTSYPANAMAIGETQLIAINCAHFRKLLLNNPELCLLILAGISEHIHHLTSQVEMLSVFDARERLLIYLNQILPAGTQNNCSYSLSISKKQIAEYLAIRPETLSRLLRQFEQEGILRWQGQVVKLLNWHK